MVQNFVLHSWIRYYVAVSKHFLLIEADGLGERESVEILCQ